MEEDRGPQKSRSDFWGGLGWEEPGLGTRRLGRGPSVRGLLRERHFVLRLPGLHLGRTLGCGQTFRWSWRDGKALGVVGESVWQLRPRGARVEVQVLGRPATGQEVRRYLLSWGPLPRLEAQLAGDPVLAKVLRHTRGISILAQDPWEVLASFLISQNNNIPKIARSVEQLCAVLGEPIGRPPVAWTFPDPGRVADAPEGLLRRALLGYRAPYLREAGRRVASGELDLAALRRLPTERAREALLELPGVGEKVADCVLLFGLGHRRVFPTDVWVHRAVAELYWAGRRATVTGVRRWALDRFGELAGLAQQHLYHYARTVLAARLRRLPRGLAFQSGGGAEPGAG